ncbi:hypothetical protein GQ55_9G314700 [Panicum hallii var. hallii]|uniref:Uncharacterized protein n=1 Tax=Panicum hallii var. hallii TaxID=1504633 RepID=A0A2T7C813_9POAL|nr:hypothetical protein GQ55_9G314700 [Panicum hallii var. hallii]
MDEANMEGNTNMVTWTASCHITCLRTPTFAIIIIGSQSTGTITNLNLAQDNALPVCFSEPHAHSAIHFTM